MKILFSLLALVMINKECAQHKNTEATQTVVDSKDSIKINQDDMRISYEALSRGFYEKIWISKDSITVTNDRNHMKSMSHPTSQKDWNELIAIVNQVDIKSLPNLEAPTAMRQYDGAAFATLAITQGKEEIKTNSFDHGHPPKAIETLVNKVLSMNDISEKH